MVLSRELGNGSEGLLSETLRERQSVIGIRSTIIPCLRTSEKREPQCRLQAVGSLLSGFRKEAIDLKEGFYPILLYGSLNPKPQTPKTLNPKSPKPRRGLPCMSSQGFQGCRKIWTSSFGALQEALGCFFSCLQGSGFRGSGLGFRGLGFRV